MILNSIFMYLSIPEINRWLDRRNLKEKNDQFEIQIFHAELC